MQPTPRPPERTAHDREHRVSRAFVDLADTLVADFDIADFLHVLVRRCADLLGVSAVGVVLVDVDGRLRVAATSSQGAEPLELFAVRTDDGPCVECVRGGAPVSCADLGTEARRWPRFTAAAHECGFRSAHALPMRLREQVVGALTLLGVDRGAPDPFDLELGQALADIATIGIVQQRAIERGGRLTGQLQAALTSRVVIEQAKGVLAERGAVTIDEAFTRMRDYARAHHLRVTDVATAVTDGTADLPAILGHRPVGRYLGGEPRGGTP
ncbi:GAF and ANTAR domain-containing protein [Actinosynnema sp. NPDC020468]|uniref:GAF and ANTAR domain-containing protein n=1 Tax=Actinosynnema sp. NPDC020468 TaxID=3154488 RepID=UPI0033C27649